MKKRLCLFWGKSTGNSAGSLIMLGGVIGGMMASSLLVGAGVSALSFSQAVDVSFEVNPTLAISLSSADLVISELSPGVSADSNVITVGVSTNAVYGYTLSATVGNEQVYTTSSLIRSDENTSEFTSLTTDASLSALSTDNTWGFSYKGTGEIDTWADYSGLPLYSDTQNTKTLIDTSGVFDTQSVEFKIAAKASATMVAGEYRNVINFIAVAKPEPTPTLYPCGANSICYSQNSLDTVEGTMATQSANAETEVLLSASNFSRAGYGFAGWNTALDYSGTTYGPNETITTPSDMSGGLSLYAVWVKPTGTLQNWNGCPALNIGDVTALTDARDEQVYAVAKLADGRCWMIENLRLQADFTRTESEKNLSQGYGTGFVGLADSEAPWAQGSTDANSIYTTESDVAGKTTISGDYLDRRFPRYNNYNTTNRASGSSATGSDNTYSYGNYYTWAAAITDITPHGSDNDNSINTSLCPTGWRLPKAGSKPNEANNEFWNLVVNGLNNGVKPDNYDANTLYFTGNPEGTDVSKLVRAYPNNFVYSGYVDDFSVRSRGSVGHYWSSTPRDLAINAYRLALGSDIVIPGTYSTYKSYGASVRCVVGGS